MAGLTVGELLVELDANTKDWRKGLDRAEDLLDKFEREVVRTGNKVDRETGKMGKGFRKVAVGVGGAATAFAGLAVAAASFVAFKLGSQAVQIAADYELLGVRLEVLTGNAEGAAQVLADVDRLVTSTPFGLQELGNAAASVAVVFGENTEAVSEFTGIAADLAAAFGRPVEQIGENLTRAFSSGLGAADVFREAGISAEILKISGASSVAEINATELADALRQLTEEGGKASGAAEKAAQTLSGSLSNAEISFSNFQRSVGQALSGAVVELANDQIIPFFEKMKGVVDENKEGMDTFARAAIPAMIDAFLALGRIVEFGVRAFGFLKQAFTGLRIAGSVLQTVFVAMFEGMRAFFDLIGTGAVVAVNGFKLIAAAARLDANAIRELSEENRTAIKQFEQRAQASAANIAAANEVTKEAIADFAKGTPVIDGLADAMGKGLDEAERFAAGIGDIGDAIEDTSDKAGRADLSGLIDPKAIAEQQKALEKLQATITKINIAQTATVDPLQAQIEKIQLQIDGLNELGQVSGDRLLAEEGIATLLAQQGDLLRQQVSTQRSLASSQGDIGTGLSQLAGVDPDATQGFAQQAGALGGISDPTKRAEAADALRLDIQEALANVETEGLQQNVAEGLTNAIGAGFLASLQDGESFAEAFGASLEQFGQAGMEEAFSKSLEFLQDGLTDLFEGLGDSLGGLLGDGLGGKLGQGLAAGAGIAASLIGGALRGTETSTTSASVRSAVTSSQQVRGVVAGPQNIPIFEVGRTIREAYEPLLEESQKQTGLLRVIASGTGTGGGEADTLDAAATSVQGTTSAAL